MYPTFFSKDGAHLVSSILFHLFSVHSTLFYYAFCLFVFHDLGKNKFQNNVRVSF